jgi:hypothetical protein
MISAKLQPVFSEITRFCEDWSFRLRHNRRQFRSRAE